MADIWGLTKKGFKPKDFSIIKDEIESELKKEIDPNLHFGPGSVAGVLTAIMANQTRQVWEELSGLYHSFRPDTASHQALEALCSLTGTFRKNATYTKATADIVLDKGITISKGSQIKSVAGDYFVTTETIKNNSDTQKKIRVEIIAQEKGPKLSYKDSSAVITNPKSGWVSVIMGPIIELGQDKESDNDLRLRRIKELKAAGSSTLDALQKNLEQLTGVQAIYIREGNCSFEVIIKGGDAEKIAQIIWQLKPLGVLSKGDIKQEIADSLGYKQEIYFSRPKTKALTLHCEVILTKNYKLNIEDELKTLILNFAQKKFRMGESVYSSHFIPALLGHKDILDVVELQLRDKHDGSAVPTPIKENEIPELGFNNIFINWPGKTA